MLFSFFVVVVIVEKHRFFTHFVRFTPNRRAQSLLLLVAPALLSQCSERPMEIDKVAAEEN